MWSGDHTLNVQYITMSFKTVVIAKEDDAHLLPSFIWRFGGERGFGSAGATKFLSSRVAWPTQATFQPGMAGL